MSEEIIDASPSDVEPMPAADQPEHLLFRHDNGTVVNLVTITPEGRVTIHEDVVNQIADAVIARSRKRK